MKRNQPIVFAIFIVVLLSGILVVSCAGCSNPNNKISDITTVTNYKTFQLKADDIRLRYMQYPLFSFEYPEIFRLVDLNLVYEEQHAITMVSGISEVDFTVQQTDLPEPILTIRVQEPGFGGMNDASRAFRVWTTNIGRPDNTENTTTSKKTVYGIQADYLEIFGTMEEYDIGGHFIYPERQRSFRGVFFDYAGLVWIITMSWQYLGAEPPEVEGYFEHVIQTFEILE